MTLQLHYRTNELTNFPHTPARAALDQGKRSEEHYLLARHIWNSPNKVLVPFVKHLAKHKNVPSLYKTLEIPLPQKNDIKNFCDVLSKKGWLTCIPHEEHFDINPNLKGEQKHFLEGGWAEEVTLYLIVDSLNEFTKNHHLKYKLFWNVQVKYIYPDTKKQNDMQLDLVAQIGDRFYVFETKSGDALGIILSGSL
jgi:hypothetical protein